MKRIFFAIVMIISLSFLTACSPTKEATPEEMPQSLESEDTIVLNFPSYASIHNVLTVVKDNLPGGADKNRSYYLFDIDLEFTDISDGTTLGVVISDNVYYGEIISDYASSGQLCEFSELNFEGENPFIEYFVTTDNPDFLNYCKEQSPKQILAYKVLKNDFDSVVVTKEVFPLTFKSITR